MDPPPSPLARVGQVFSAFLNYVTAAVQRYLTPEPVNTGNDDTLTGQEATVSMTTKTLKWTEADNQEKEKKQREEREQIADACNNRCGHATTLECGMVSIATETNTKTDQHVAKDIKVRVTGKVIESGEIVGNEPTTHREEEANCSQFTDERETERYDTVLKHAVLTVPLSTPGYFEERGIREQGNKNEDYYQDKADGVQKPKPQEEKTNDKERGKLFSGGGGEEQTETTDRYEEEQTETKDRDGEGQTETTDRYGEEQTETTDRDGEEQTETTDRDGEDRTEAKHRYGEDRTEAKDRYGEDRTGAKDRDGEKTEAKDGDGERQTETEDRGGEGQTEAKDRDGEDWTETEDSGGEEQTEAIDRDGEDRTETKDRDGEDRTETKDRDGEEQTEAMDRDGEDRTETKDRGGEKKTEAKDRGGEGQTEAKDRDGEDRTEAKDRYGEDRTGAKDRDGEKTEAKDGDGERQTETEDRGGEGQTEAKDRDGEDRTETEDRGGEEQTEAKDRDGEVQTEAKDRDGEKTEAKDRYGEEQTEAKDRGGEKQTEAKDRDGEGQTETTDRYGEVQTETTDRYGEVQTETKDRGGGREEHHTGLIRKHGVKTIGGAEEENEDLSELMEEAMQIMEEDEFDTEQEGLRSREGPEQNMPPKGNDEDGGQELKWQFVSRASGVGDDNIRTVVIGRQGGVKETVSGKGGLDNKNIGRDRVVEEGKDNDRYEEKESRQQLLIEEQYGKVSGSEEGKEDDGEELTSAVYSSGAKKRHVERGEKRKHACDIKGGTSTGSRNAGQVGKAFNTREEESCTERESGEKESGENFADEKTRAEFEGMEREGSQQRTDDDRMDESECKGRKLKTNWDQVGTILIEGAGAGDEVSKVSVQGKREEPRAAIVGGQKSGTIVNKTEIETRAMIENCADGWQDILTIEQKINESERGQNENDAVGRQIGASKMEGDFDNNELYSVEVVVGNKETESKEYGEEHEMEIIGLRNIETESRELKGIAEECRNSMAKEYEEKMIEGKQEHEKHSIKENKEEPLVGHRDIRHNFEPAVETAAGAMGVEGDVEEEILVLKEEIGWERTKEVGKSEYGVVLEANRWGIEEKGEDIPVGRNEKGVLRGGTYSGVERDLFTEETGTEENADERDIGLLGTGEHERIIDIGINEKDSREIIVEEKEEEQREGGACSEDKDMERVKMRKTETEEECINREKERKDYDGISVEELREDRQFSEIMTEGKQREAGNYFDSVEIETGEVDEEVDDDVEKEREEECKILKGGTGEKYTIEMRESEYSAYVWGTQEERDDKGASRELMAPVPVEGNENSLLSEETHSGVERVLFTEETETDKDADEKDVGPLSAGEYERITDFGRNENDSREIIVEKKEEEQREGGACSEDKDMESVEMRKTETEEECINREKERKDYDGISVEDLREDKQFSEIMTEENPREVRHYFESVEIETGEVDEEVDDDDVEKEREEEYKILKGGTGEKYTKETRESEYHANAWGTQEERDEKEARHKLMAPVPVEGNENSLLSEEMHASVERVLFTEETETDKDADEKDVGPLSAGEYERITDFGRNENDSREILVEKEEEQREGGACSEDKDMERVEMSKVTNKSGRETEKDKSIDETENIHAVRQEIEIRGEIEEQKDIKAPVEEVYHKGALEQLVLEEGDELIREGWKEDIQREEREGSSDGVQVNVILDGDGQEGTEDEAMPVEEQGQLTELITEIKQENREKDFDTTIEMEGGRVDEEEDAKEEKEEILKETGRKNTKEVGESEYRGEMEASVWGTEEKGDQIDGRPEEERKVLTSNREIHDTFGMEVSGSEEDPELKGQEAELKGLERNSEVLKPSEIPGKKYDDRETEEKTTIRLDNEEIEGLNIEGNGEMKETIDNWVELHTPSLDFTAQKSRMSLRNARSRPPRDPRSLLNATSLLPTPSGLPQPDKLSAVPMPVKRGGPVITGFKLPGMGREFPALKKTHTAVREGQGVTAENSRAPEVTKTLKSDREQVVGGKVAGMGGIGVKLPGFSAEFPGLRKTERGAKMREQTPEKNLPSQNNSTERSDSTESYCIKDVKQIGFGSGFTELRRTERGLRIREGEDTQLCTQNSEVEVKTPGVDHQESLLKAKSTRTPPGKPGIGIGNPSMISELKNKLRKTE